MRHHAAAVLTILLISALVVLATLQYRWLGKLSAAEELRLRGAVEGDTRHLADDVNHELQRLHGAFIGVSNEPDDLARHAHDWSLTTHDPRLVSAIYVVEGPRLRSLHGEQLIPMDDWPADMHALRNTLMAEPTPVHRAPVVTSIPAMVLPLRPGGPPPPRPVAPSESEGPGGPGGYGFFPPPPRPPADARGDRPRPRPGNGGTLILRLDRDYLVGTFIPELARRYFGAAQKYDVAVVDAAEHVLYRSDASWPSANDKHAEAEATLLNIGPEERQTVGAWRLLVRRRGAPLADVVAATRRRNLAVSGGVLLLLAASVVMLGIVARQTERFRRQQLEFVAGITHELNTPIAALRSAGQNLADGIVTEPARVTQYGATIVKESRRLSDTVAQVLDFAGLQAAGGAREEDVDVGAAIDDAIAQCAWLADERQVAIEPHVAGDLPRIHGDGEALTRAIQNLVANAIRHGGDGKWVGVSAARDRNAIVIRVEDRGPGVAARDVAHLFEPFYRGRGSSRVRGSGLGLTIVNQVAKRHGGSAAVERRRERGAAFVLRIPVAHV